MTTIRFDVPIKAQSTSNLREHWGAKAKRVDAQKRAARARCPPWTGGPLLVVTLTRVAPRALDDDNLRGALKSVRDAVATWLRVDDASPLVRWEYGQEKGAEPCVRVEVRGAEETVPVVPPAPDPVREMATVENGLLPAPRKACQKGRQTLPMDTTAASAPPPDYDNGYDRWWGCTAPNCHAFFDNPEDRDAHSATCPGQEEIPF